MKYTKEQLQGMSDFEINTVLAILNGFKIGLSRDGDAVCCYKSFSDSSFKDYCNSPSEVMPLAFENKIGVQHFNRGNWQAHSQGDEVFHDKNPLRAIACCLILVLQENEK